MIHIFPFFLGNPINFLRNNRSHFATFQLRHVTTIPNNRNKTTGSISERVTHIELQKQRNNFGVREFADKRKEKTNFINPEKRTNED